MTKKVSKPSPPLIRRVVARAEDIVEGGRLLLTVEGKEIGIYRLKGKYYALLNRCPHLGGPLCKGGVVSEIYAPVPGDVRNRPDRLFVTCPWHNWEFDVVTGQSYCSARGPKARTFPIEVERGAALLATAVGPDGTGRIPGPYKAETINVTVEDDYLVVAMRPARPGRESSDAP